MYKIVFGVFDKAKDYDAEGQDRQFTEVFESVPYSRDEMLEKLKAFVRGFKESYLDKWITTPGKPITFIDGEWEGHRIYKAD